jgi:hypothetical protein
MGLSVYEAAMLAQLVSALPRRDTVVCLGMPNLDFQVSKLRQWSRQVGGHWDGPGLPATARLSAPDFFRTLGFEHCLALDISAYEGAAIVHDLNRADLPAQHHGIADLVFDGGTLEHIFHVPNALTTVHQLLRVDGLAVHSTPSNGYLDHGFYQLCPTLLYDYYRANEYRIVSANVINRYPRVRCEPYLEDIYRERGFRHVLGRLPRASTFFAVAKTASSTCNMVPMQSYYRQLHDHTKQVYSNEAPFSFRAPSPKLGSRVRSLASKVQRHGRELIEELQGRARGG